MIIKGYYNNESSRQELLKFIELQGIALNKANEVLKKQNKAIREVKAYCQHVHLSSEYGNADNIVAGAIESILRKFEVLKDVV